jgi:hypothetical protein
MKNAALIFAIAALIAAPALLADKPGSAPGHDKGGWDSHKKGYQDKHGDLPHGMQKKLERTGELPPGWEKKLEVGSVLDPELYARSTRLPTEFSARLPIRPEGTFDVRIQDRAVRLRERDGRITDVYRLNLR